MDYSGLLAEVTEELEERDEYSGLHLLPPIEGMLIQSYSRDYIGMRKRGAGPAEISELQKTIEEELKLI